MKSRSEERAAPGTRGIRCNTVAPGLTLTAGVVSNTTDEYIEASRRNYPMPRLCAPEDVAKAVVFLASDDAAYVNTVTGGLQARKAAPGAATP